MDVQGQRRVKVIDGEVDEMRQLDFREDLIELVLTVFLRKADLQFLVRDDGGGIYCRDFNRGSIDVNLKDDLLAPVHSRGSESWSV